MNSVPNDVAKSLVESIGDELMATLTAIRTEYTDGRMRFSGTGLLLSDAEARIYCLTANHVVSPNKRSNPIKCDTKRHYHSQFLKEGRKYESFAFRWKFYKNEEADLAILESCLSETEKGREYVGRVMTLEALIAAGSVAVFSNDILVLAGLPAAQLCEIPVTRESNHGALFSFFSANQGSVSNAGELCYEVPYAGDHSPCGMSGSPVWVIREAAKADRPLNVGYVRSTPPGGQRLNATFLGIALQYIESTRKILIVKPGACAAFANSARAVMPTIRVPEEDDWIRRCL